MGICDDVSITLSDGGHSLILQKPGLQPITCHPLWLRERVKDQAYFDTITHQRLYEHCELSEDLKIETMAHNHTNMTLTFSDGCESRLELRELLSEIGWSPNTEAIPLATAWDATLSPLPEYDWNTLDDPSLLKSALEAYFEYGFVIFQNTPQDLDSLKHLSRRFGYLRETNFGELFNVETKRTPSDLAYTDVALASHTDNPYRLPVPGIQFLHCLVNNVSGGLSTLVDGLKLVKTLEQENPDALRVLETLNVRFRYQGAAGIFESHAPIITRDSEGHLKHICLSSRLDYVPYADHETLSLFYAGRKRLNALSQSSAFQIQFPFRAGTLLMMNNYRLLHGRTAFDSAEGHRHLQGCYIDHDGPDSLYRMLANGSTNTHVVRDI